MGLIRIELGGSFGKKVYSFSAMKNGHADAVASAIEWLSGVVLPDATALDHKLHENGDKPQDGFERKGR